MPDKPELFHFLKHLQMATLEDMQEYCDTCCSELEVGQIGNCDSCQGMAAMPQLPFTIIYSNYTCHWRHKPSASESLCFHSCFTEAGFTGGLRRRPEPSSPQAATA